MLCVTRYSVPQKIRRKSSTLFTCWNNLLLKILAFWRFTVEPKGRSDPLYNTLTLKYGVKGKNWIDSQEKFTNYMAESWNSKDNTMYTLPAALNLYYIHAASIISMGLFNIYKRVISQRWGWGKPMALRAVVPHQCVPYFNQEGRELFRVSLHCFSIIASLMEIHQTNVLHEQ